MTFMSQVHNFTSVEWSCLLLLQQIQTSMNALATKRIKITMHV